MGSEKKKKNDRGVKRLLASVQLKSAMEKGTIFLSFDRGKRKEKLGKKEGGGLLGCCSFPLGGVRGGSKSGKEYPRWKKKGVGGGRKIIPPENIAFAGTRKRPAWGSRSVNSRLANHNALKGETERLKKRGESIGKGDRLKWTFKRGGGGKKGVKPQ